MRLFFMDGAICGIMKPMTINPRTAPAASQQNKPSKTHSSTPSLWRRFASMMYEGILLFGVIFLASYLFDTLTQSRSGMTLRSEEHTSELQSLMRISYAVFCLKKK